MRGPGGVLACDMRSDCMAEVTHVDEKGFVYCSGHGAMRKIRCKCRKLKPAELKRLKAGGVLGRY